MNDRSRDDSEKLKSLSEELFEEIRAIVRQGADHHLEAIYNQKKAELQQWLTDECE
ncbi:MAG: hypothetical protein J07HQW1_02941 [Haloquadratum walsbyi J07HQW1]|uniref:Transposase n=1 Tax=Haloquadratum walsbyi J07HQW1 TaxID=1238424 RepID=U1PH00_9EURY|nr:MAG: hypothetical protein J07HQW1_02941 [Haloquadratum walsbyi J07HQW1]